MRRAHHLAAAVGLALTLASAPAQAQQAPPGYRLVWHDEFDRDGLPDPAEVELRRRRSRLGQQGAAVLHGPSSRKRPGRRRAPGDRGAGASRGRGRRTRRRGSSPGARATGPMAASRCARSCLAVVAPGPPSGCCPPRQRRCDGQTMARSTSWSTWASTTAPCMRRSTRRRITTASARRRPRRSSVADVAGRLSCLCTRLGP